MQIPIKNTNRIETISADCIITAAGLSSRMGRWKMILPYLDGTILDASIKNALSICRRVILVTGYRSEELLRRYQGESLIHCIHNPHYQSGMFSSIQTAAAQVASDYFFIAHGDMPGIAPRLFQQLWQQRGPYSLFPCYQGKAGHPVLLPAAKVAGIIEAPAQSSMRQLLQAGECRYLEVTSAAIHQDVDTQEEYHRLLIPATGRLKT